MTMLPEPVTPTTDPAVAYLERDYDRPNVFARPPGAIRGQLILHVDGMYMAKDDHYDACPCSVAVNVYGARWSSDQGWHPRFRDPLNDTPARAPEGVAR